MTDSIENQPLRRSWVKVLLVGALLLGASLIALTALWSQPDEPNNASQEDQRVQHAADAWRQELQEDYDEWYAREDDEVFEDNAITLDDGSPGIERCHYTWELKGEKGEFFYQMRPHKELTHCEELPGDTETTEAN